MSLSCITGGRLCDGCMACYDDPHYCMQHEEEQECEEEYINE